MATYVWTKSPYHNVVSLNFDLFTGQFFTVQFKAEMKKHSALIQEKTTPSIRQKSINQCEAHIEIALIKIYNRPIMVHLFTIGAYQHGNGGTTMVLNYLL